MSLPTPSITERGAAGPLFTIFIPTYNRAYILPEAIASIDRLTLRDFEVVVVDDGSTDDTRALVEQWAARSDVPVRYVWQENQGMHASINTAAEHAHGFFTIRLDSDDKMLPDALTHIQRRWQSIPESERPRFAGVSGLCLNEDGTISGDPYPRDVIDSDYLEIYKYCRMNGERREALRTDVMREYPYPRIEGERRLRASLMLKRLSHRYKIRFTNDVLQVNRHAADGISKNRFKYRMKYPKGQRLYYLEEITLNDRYSSWWKLHLQHRSYVRYALHSGVGLRTQASEVKHKLLWLSALPLGWLNWLRDRARIHG